MKKLLDTLRVYFLLRSGYDIVFTKDGAEHHYRVPYKSVDEALLWNSVLCDGWLWE